MTAERNEMRKVVFHIDDVAYFKKIYGDAYEPDKNTPNFKAMYALFGNGKVPDRYALVSLDSKDFGSKLNLNDLNGFQKGIVLCDCKRYFEGFKEFNFGSKEPCGVLSITESETERYDDKLTDDLNLLINRQHT